MSNCSYTVEAIGDWLEEYLSIAGEGLHATDRSLWELYVQRIGRENIRCVHNGSDLAGGLAFYRMAQWFGGKRLPAADFLRGFPLQAGQRFEAA